ncbi:hypothetical protein AYL99_11970 [Fonsecaea erecta]|uniref:Uncharacterized protein n=1 Tax=Fonsecaea erecta TaxID=1367422 RepID=A0A178Z2B2_9EURO|nr:hypothetical protein AYL99_11970 [Fonsecaea erecta]OAP53847.1 hypothetical protein AYL99_11970 [Fonsecaea erecta]
MAATVARSHKLEYDLEWWCNPSDNGLDYFEHDVVVIRDEQLAWSSELHRRRAREDAVSQGDSEEERTMSPSTCRSFHEEQTRLTFGIMEKTNETATLTPVLDEKKLAMQTVRCPGSTKIPTKYGHTEPDKWLHLLCGKLPNFLDIPNSKVCW